MTKNPQILRCNTQWPLIKDIVVYIRAVVHNKHEFYAAIIDSQIRLDPFVVTLFVAQQKHGDILELREASEGIQPGFGSVNLCKVTDIQRQNKVLGVFWHFRGSYTRSCSVSTERENILNS